MALLHQHMVPSPTGVSSDHRALPQNLVAAEQLANGHGRANEPHRNRVAASADRHQRIGRDDPVTHALTGIEWTRT